MAEESGVAAYIHGRLEQTRPQGDTSRSIITGTAQSGHYVGHTDTSSAREP